MRRIKRRTKKIRRKLGGASAEEDPENYLKQMAKPFLNLEYYVIGMGACKVVSEKDFYYILSIKELPAKFLLTCHGMNPGAEPFELTHLNISRFGCGPQNKNASVHCVFNLRYMTQIMRNIEDYRDCLHDTTIPNKKGNNTDSKYFENYILTNWDQVERDHTAGLYFYDIYTGELIPVLLFCKNDNHILDLKLFALFIERNFCENGVDCELITIFCRDYEGPNANRRAKSLCAPSFNINSYKIKVESKLGYNRSIKRPKR